MERVIITAYNSISQTNDEISPACDIPTALRLIGATNTMAGSYTYYAIKHPDGQLQF